jgi:hypothetical protein
MIGAKTLVTLALFAIGVAAAVAFGVLAPVRLASHGTGTLFFIGCFAVVIGTLIFRFWRLDEPSAHYFRFAPKRDHFTTEEAHFVGGENRRVTLGDNRGEAFDLGARLQHALCIGLALLLALACINARALGLLDGFRAGLDKKGAIYCPEPEAQAKAAVDPNLPGCELIRRAFALGYAKSLGQCAPQHQSAAAPPPCTRRQRDEPVLHYAWRLLDKTWTKLHSTTTAKHELAVDLGRAGERGRAQVEMLASAPHASHHLWTNLPDPGGAFGPRSCEDRYRWMAHRPAPIGERQSSQVLEHVLAQLLFEGRYEPAAASCREFHVHWNAPLDTCKRLAADPRAVLASALSEIDTVVKRQRGGSVSFQCYFEDVAAPATSMPFQLAGRDFTVDELHVPPSPANAMLYTDRYDAVARLLVRGFHYGALLSEAGIQGTPGGMQAAFGGNDYLLTRLYGLDAVDIYLEAGFLVTRPDLLEVYPYQRHLRNYVQLFRRQYARGRL